MDNLLSLKRNRMVAIDKAEAILAAAESAKRDLTVSEQENFNATMKEASSIASLITARERVNTLKPSMLMPSVDGAVSDPAFQSFVSPVRAAQAQNPEQGRALHAFFRTGGKAHTDELLTLADGEGGYRIPGSEAYTRQRAANGSFLKIMAATYEGTPDGGSDAAGGYAVSVPTVQQVVPLALPDLGIYDASMVIPTVSAVKIPVQASFGTSAIKAESTGTIATFGGTDPTLGQIELDAYMVGAVRIASWELLQDVAMWQEFIVDDLLKGHRILEDSLLATGTGSNQPTGVFGNTGTGTGSAYELLGTSADSQTLLDSLFDVTSTLKGAYQANASWIMSRATALTIRRAQMQTNLFAPVATVDADGTERILGRPVFYDVNSPSLPTATSSGVPAILFGDFKQGFVVGVRGGAGINVKILDQPLAMQGQLAILAYRRIDSKVRRSEAIQAITISHS
jgi:HK97 family phage major capsid protein